MNKKKGSCLIILLLPIIAAMIWVLNLFITHYHTIRYPLNISLKTHPYKSVDWLKAIHPRMFFLANQWHADNHLYDISMKYKASKSDIKIHSITYHFYTNTNGLVHGYFRADLTKKEITLLEKIDFTPKGEQKFSAVFSRQLPREANQLTFYPTRVLLQEVESYGGKAFREKHCSALCYIRHSPVKSTALLHFQYSNANAQSWDFYRSKQGLSLSSSDRFNINHLLKLIYPEAQILKKTAQKIHFKVKHQTYSLTQSTINYVSGKIAYRVDISKSIEMNLN